jgi:hypothetical protein
MTRMVNIFALHQLASAAMCSENYMDGRNYFKSLIHVVKDLELNVENSRFRQSLSTADTDCNLCFPLVARAAFWCIFFVDSVFSLVYLVTKRRSQSPRLLSYKGDTSNGRHTNNASFVPSCQDDLFIHIMSSDSPFTPTLGHVNIVFFFTLLFKVANALADLKRSYISVPNQEAFLALDMLESTLGLVT